MCNISLLYICTHRWWLSQFKFMLHVLILFLLFLLEQTELYIALINKVYFVILFIFLFNNFSLCMCICIIYTNIYNLFIILWIHLYNMYLFDRIYYIFKKFQKNSFKTIMNHHHYNHHYHKRKRPTYCKNIDIRKYTVKR